MAHNRISRKVFENCGLNEQHLNNKEKQTNREGWEAAGALWPEELVSTIIHTPSTSIGWAGALFRCFGLPA